jgi:hypothetical protein
MKIPDARSRYVKFLGEMATDPSDEEIAAELVDSGLVKGEPALNSSGNPIAGSMYRITVEGRLFLQRLGREIEDESFLGQVKAKGSLIVAFLVGVGSELLTQYLSKRFGLG